MKKVYIENDVTNFKDLIALANNMNKNSIGFIYVVLAAYCDVYELPDDSEDTAYTVYIPHKRTFTIYINTTMFDTIPKIAYILAHEVLHNLLGHGTRRTVLEYNKKNKNVTDLILDAHVNGIIEKNIYPGLTVEGAVHFHYFEEIAKQVGESWRWNPEKLENPIEQHIEELKWLYDLAQQNQDQQQQGGGNGDDGDSDKGKGGGSPLDDMDPLDNHEKNSQQRMKDGEKSDGEIDAENDMIENSLKGLAEEANAKFKETAKNMGSGDGFYNRLHKNLKKPKKTFLVPRVMAAVSDCNKQSDLGTYSLPNKMSSAYGYKKKEYYPLPRQKAVVAIDVSGSVDDKTMEEFLSASMKIKADLDIIFWSDHTIGKESINKDVKENGYNKLKIHSTGGTDIKTLYRAIEEEYSEPIMLLVFSDMYFTDHVPPENVKGLYLLDSEPEGSFGDNRKVFYKRLKQLKHFMYKKVIEIR